jgi:hypothetical protein
LRAFVPGGLVAGIEVPEKIREFVKDLVIFEVLEVFDVSSDDRVGGIQFEHRMYEW